MSLYWNFSFCTFLLFCPFLLFSPFRTLSLDFISYLLFLQPGRHLWVWYCVWEKKCSLYGSPVLNSDRHSKLSSLNLVFSSVYVFQRPFWKVHFIVFILLLGNEKFIFSIILWNWKHHLMNYFSFSALSSYQRYYSLQTDYWKVSEYFSGKFVLHVECIYVIECILHLVCHLNKLLFWRMEHGKGKSHLCMSFLGEVS